jgi:hypothetical protein
MCCFVRKPRDKFCMYRVPSSCTKITTQPRSHTPIRHRRVLVYLGAYLRRRSLYRDHVQMVVVMTGLDNTSVPHGHRPTGTHHGRVHIAAATHLECHALPVLTGDRLRTYAARTTAADTSPDSAVFNTLHRFMVGRARFSQRHPRTRTNTRARARACACAFYVLRITICVCTMCTLCTDKSMCMQGCTRTRHAHTHTHKNARATTHKHVNAIAHARTDTDSVTHTRARLIGLTSSDPSSTRHT